jgi:hypothetical protein
MRRSSSQAELMATLLPSNCCSHSYLYSARGRIDHPALDVTRGAVDEWRALLKHHKLEP